MNNNKTSFLTLINRQILSAAENRFKNRMNILKSIFKSFVSWMICDMSTFPTGIQIIIISPGEFKSLSLYLSGFGTI